MISELVGVPPFYHWRCSSDDLICDDPDDQVSSGQNPVTRKIFKKLLFLSALLTLVVPSASAGVVIHMKMTSQIRGEKHRYNAVMSIVPLAARIEVTPTGESGVPMSVVIRLDKKRMWFILPGAENYYEMTFEALGKLQNDGRFNWKNSNPMETGAGATYTRLRKTKKILGVTTRLYRVTQDDAEGTAFVRERPRDRTLDKFQANQARVFAAEGFEVETPDLPGVVLAADIRRDNGDRHYWIATSFKKKRLAADTFEPPPGATPVTFDAAAAEQWAQGIEEFKANFAEAVKEEIRTQAKESVKREGRKAVTGAAKKIFKGLFRR